MTDREVLEWWDYLSLRPFVFGPAAVVPHITGSKPRGADDLHTLLELPGMPTREFQGRYNPRQPTSQA